MADFLFLLVGFIFFAAEVRSLQLENVCFEDIFNYNGMFVNAFHRIGQVVYLPEIGYFLVPETEEFTFLLDYSNDNPDPSLRNEILKIKSDYNSRLQEIYSERYVNGPNFETSIRSESEFFDRIAERVQQVRERLNKSHELFDKRVSAFRKGQQLVDYLLPFLSNQLQPLRPIGYVGLQPSKEKQYAALESTLKRLDTDENQTLAFRDDYMTDVYEQPIVTRPKLEFSRFSKYSRTFFDPKSGGRLRFEIVLPFYNADYERWPCTDTAKLPKFFSKNKVL